MLLTFLKAHGVRENLLFQPRLAYLSGIPLDAVQKSGGEHEKSVVVSVDRSAVAHHFLDGQQQRLRGVRAVVAGHQEAQVDAFVGQLGVLWSGTLHKALEVWCFPDCEVVYYEASTASRAVRCVEFEATRKDSLSEALATVGRFERATGFQATSRSRLSLPQILFPELRDRLART